MKRGFTITYSIHPTPLRPGESVQTYHVRHEQERVIHTKELRQHIASYTIISEGLFAYRHNITRAELLTTLATLCRDRGSFTRSDFQRIFNVSRYKADQILTDLVSEPYPKYYRQKRGKAWLYRKTGT